MKRIQIAAIAVIIAVVTGGILAGAQILHQGGFGRHPGSSNNHHHEQIINHLADKLKLTDDQKTRAKQILVDSKPRFQPLHEQFKQSHRTSIELSATGVFDEQKARELAGQQAEIIKQVLIEEDRTMAQLFAVLTPEQREQAKQMLNHLFENLGH